MIHIISKTYSIRYDYYQYNVYLHHSYNCIIYIHIINMIQLFVMYTYYYNYIHVIVSTYINTIHLMYIYTFISRCINTIHVLNTYKVVSTMY